MKLCKDCMWARPDRSYRPGSKWHWHFAKCGRPPGRKPDPVTGIVEATDPWYCSTQRKSDQHGDPDWCGRAGKLWEPKPPAPLETGWRAWASAAIAWWRG